MHTIASGVRIKISYAGLSNIYLAIRLYLIIQYVFTDLLIAKTYRKHQLILQRLEIRSFHRLRQRLRLRPCDLE